MDKISGDTAKVLVIGGTTAPWDLRSEALAKFPTRLHVTLPDVSTRVEILVRAVGSKQCEMRQQDYHMAALKMEGFSDAEIRSAIRMALMRPISRIRRATHYQPVRQSPLSEFCTLLGIFL